MTKSALALGSFIVGACFSFLALSLSQTSTRVQAAQGTAVNLAKEPVVPPLYMRREGFNLGGFAFQAFDGITCVGFSIEAPLITYAGGAFSCDGCSIRAGRVQPKPPPAYVINGASIEH